MKRILSLLLAAVLLASMFAFVGCSKEDEPDDFDYSELKTTTKESTTKQSEVNPITNATGFSKSAIGKRPVAVVINNSPQARPQWGISAADAVIEVCVEGRVTRNIFLFADEATIPEKIGPVRSARHHLVYLAAGMGARFVHWGGSTMGYDALAAEYSDNIDAMKQGSYFYRDTSRNTAIEHRGVSDGDKLRQAFSDNNVASDRSNSTIYPFVFAGKVQTLAGGACSSIKVFFSSGYDHTFTYDQATGLYTNAIGATVVTDANNGEEMKVSNVIVLYAPSKTLSNDLMDVDLTGGDGVYVSNGSYVDIKWSKGNDGTSELKLTDVEGNPLKLNSGKSWIGIAPSDTKGNTVIS